MSKNSSAPKIIDVFGLSHGFVNSTAAIDLSDLTFSPYAVQGREVVSLHVLYGERGTAGVGSTAALVRYDAGARTPRHLHPGSELILVLDGELIDDNGRHGPGSLAAPIHRGADTAC